MALPSGITMLVASAFTYMAMMLALSALYTHTQELYCTMLRGDGVGWLTGIGFATAVMAPVIITPLNQIFSIEVSMCVIAACFVTASALPLLLLETRPID